MIEIGRKSECSTGVELFGTGRIEAYFHCRGTTDVTMDFSNRRAMGLQKIGAPIGVGTKLVDSLSQLLC